MIIPNRKNDNAFHGYHNNNPYVETLCVVVGGGDADAGACRVPSVMGSKLPELYVQEGQSKGSTMKKPFDKVALAAMAVDCHLKDWQLKKAMMHFHFTTGCMPSV
jgi:hypothetical protein